MWAYNTGDVIETLDGVIQDNGEVWIAGHLDPDEAVTCAQRVWTEYFGTTDKPPEYRLVRHSWGRWVECEEDDEADPEADFVWDGPYSTQPADSSFIPYTIIIDPRTHRQNEERRAVNHWLRHRARRSFPDCEILHVYASDWSRAHESEIRMRTPCGLLLDWKPFQSGRNILVRPARFSICTSRVALIERATRYTT